MKSKNNIEMIRRLVFISLLLCPMALFAQSGKFVIKGKMTNLNAPEIIFLSYRTEDGKDVRDTCVLKNGKFEFKGYVNNPLNFVTLRLQRDRTNGIPIWLEPGTMMVNGTDALQTATITGSKLNMAEEKLKTAQKSIDERLRELIKDRKTIDSSEFAIRYKAIKDERIEVIRKFILANPTSLVSLWQLWRAYGPMKYNNKRGIEEVEPMFNNFSAAVRNSKLGKEYRATLDKWKVVGIGQLAPDFVLYNEERNPVKLSDFKGKYILVDFWASWCHPCRAENPNLLGQYQLYKDKNFEILGVSIDVEKNWDKWIKAIKEDQLTWPQVVGTVQNNEAYVKFNVQSIPDNFLISPDGYILAKGLRGEELNEKLAEILAYKK